MAVLVRGAGRRDLESIHELWQLRRDREHKLDASLSAAPSAAAETREHRELILADPRTRIVVAEERGRVLGFGHAQIESNDLGFLPERIGVLVDLVVREEARGRGLARQLMDELEGWLRSRGIDEMRARVLEADEEAHAFLRRLGGEPFSAVLRKSLCDPG